MDKKKESATSVGVAMLRAVHQLTDPGPKILSDEVIVRLLPRDAAGYIATHRARYNNPGARSLRSHVLVRSRYAEDCLEEACRRGTTQYLLLGAGLDTFAYRQPPWAGRLQVFELDHPQSQAHKRQLLANAGIPVPENVFFVPADLEHTSFLTALAGTSFNPAAPVFISWLGVMVYLSGEANQRILRDTASLRPGSGMVFTFSEKDRPGETGALAALAARQGEPWLSRTTLEELRDLLAQTGFPRIDFPSPEEFKRRYFQDPRTDLPPLVKRRIVYVGV